MFGGLRPITNLGPRMSRARAPSRMATRADEGWVATYDSLSAQMGNNARRHACAGRERPAAQGASLRCAPSQRCPASQKPAFHRPGGERMALLFGLRKTTRATSQARKRIVDVDATPLAMAPLLSPTPKKVPAAERTAVSMTMPVT
jgi:hypothetical protein